MAYGIADAVTRTDDGSFHKVILEFAKRHNLNPATLMPLDGSPAPPCTPYVPESVMEPDWLAINRELST